MKYLHIRDGAGCHLTAHSRNGIELTHIADGVSKSSLKLSRRTGGLNGL